jgi:CelD/BcsL family acetyltransferase involved in cellulose biosynthesis
LHGVRWSAGSGFLPTFDRFATAARLGIERGEVVFHELVHDGTVIASEVDLELAGRTSFYQSGRLDDRRWRGSGTVLKAKVVERACARGQHEYDLLRGAEPYKDAWATGTRPLAGVVAVRGVGGHLAVGAQRGTQLARAARRRLAVARRGGAGRR